MDREAPPPVRRAWWLLGVLPLLPALVVGFLLDDWIGLAGLTESGWGAVAEQARPLGGEFLRPLGWALFQVELTAFGLRALAFHAVHLGLFVLGAWLTGRLAACFGGSERLAGVAAALALLYPGRTEAYTWLAAGFDLLALDLSLTLLLLHLRWRRRPGLGRPLALLILAFTSTLAKESAYAVLPVLLLWELLPGLLPPAPRRGRLAAGAGVAAGFGLGALYRLWALGGVGGYAGTTAERTLGRLESLPDTLLRAAFAPVNPHYGTGSLALATACGVALAAALAVALVRARRQGTPRRLLAAGSSLALVGLLPALPYLSPAAPWAASRFFTLFGSGLAVAVVAAAAGREEHPSRAGRAAVVGLVAAWTATTVLNLLPWLEAARGRDLILDAIEADTRRPGPHRVWIAGPINRLKGVHLLGGALQSAVDVTFPEREIEADSAFFQRFQGRPVGPPRPGPGVEVHRYRFDPTAAAVHRLPEPGARPGRR